jgi:nucleotide-binding universal stress UspA family protein
MFKRILVPIDGSEYSEKAIRAVLDIIKTTENVLLTLVHVVEPAILRSITPRYDTLSAVTPSITMSKNSEIMDLKRAYEILTWGKKIVTESGINVNLETKIIVGSTANAILTEAENGDYDLIVIGSDKPHGIKGIGSGLVNKVVNGTPCSILIIK